MTTKRIVITAGEPAGIGPDLTLALSQESWPHQLVVCADKTLLAERAKLLGIKVEFLDYDATAAKEPQRSGTLVVKHVPLSESTIAGQLNEANGHYVLNTLETAAIIELQKYDDTKECLLKKFEFNSDEPLKV